MCDGLTMARVLCHNSEFAKLMDGADGRFEIRSKLDKYSARQRGYRKLTKVEYMQGWRMEDRDGLPVLRKVRHGAIPGCLMRHGLSPHPAHAPFLPSTV